MSHDTPVLYGPQTRRALENFPGPGRRLNEIPEVVRSYAWVKAAAARANADLGVLDDRRAAAIVQACEEMADLRHQEQFPTPLVQGGGGTSTNMNVNEVIASLATTTLRAEALPVHPNDHVNRSQSTNDTYPTAMALALWQLAQPALASVRHLADAVAEKGEEYQDTLRLGRTCLQDAVPLSIGQTHRAQVSALRRHEGEVRAAAEAMRSVPLGATAVGTGLGAPDGYPERVCDHLRSISGIEVVTSEDLFDSLAHLDPYARLASAAARALITTAKIAADLRLLSSGPTGGLGEVDLPRLQAGSSIMPGKVNPVIPELVMQLSYRARGAAHTVEMGVAAGELELNIMEPVILDACITILGDLSTATRTLADKCISGLAWNADGLRRNLRGSLHERVEAAVDGGYEQVVQQLTAAIDGSDASRREGRQ